MISVTRRLERIFTQPAWPDLLYFLTNRRREEVEALYGFAQQIRREYMGGAIHLRGLIEFSNHCRRQCRYCGLNRNNKHITRYRMSKEEILATAREAISKGYKTVVLQSGEASCYSRQDFLSLLREIKKSGDLAITLSVGEKSPEEYRAYFEAGADRFLLKHETSDPVLYRALNPGMSLARRLKCLKVLKEIGFQTGSGIMIGLPGQTLESIADDILLFKTLAVDMIGCGPYIPHPATPLFPAKTGSEELSYRVLALNRIVNPRVHLPVTTALSTLNENRAAKLALNRGANVIMPNLTPYPYRRFYEIYPLKDKIEADTGELRKKLESLALSLGRYIA
jgi:biotin synthase